ncbi:MAG TPA: hypothetical protein EYH50_00700 [Pyrodictium delaneyi]|uniref:Ribonuclease P protein component 3 n=1 Tax=Pyrodictium delaneyi TaxID=1273541 RepID=A0A833A0V4_9CREN|nr:hypothetical protein [Pyrodictium delaneyi]
MKSVDLALEPRSLRDAMEMASLAKMMGYRLVAIENSDPQRAREYARVFTEEGIEALTRITIEADSWGMTVNILKRIALNFDLVAVKPKSVEAVRLAARDPRVGLVVLSPGMARYMDKSQAAMLREGGAAVELRFLPLLHGGDPRAGLRGTMIIARRAAAYEAPLVVTSGARTRWEMWHPRTMHAMLVAFGLPENIAKLAITGYPAAIVNTKARHPSPGGEAV